MLFRSVPVLALNRDNVAPPINSASFSLAPEDEGSSAADHVASLGARRVLVLSSGDDYARRSASAFATQLATHGGSVVQTLAVVSDEPADMTPLLQSVATREGGIRSAERRVGKECVSPCRSRGSPE